MTNPIFNVTIQLADGTTFIWSGRARTQYRAEFAAMVELRNTTSQPVASIQCEEPSNG